MRAPEIGSSVGPHVPEQRLDLAPVHVAAGRIVEDGAYQLGVVTAHGALAVGSLTMERTRSPTAPEGRCAARAPTLSSRRGGRCPRGRVSWATEACTALRCRSCAGSPPKPNVELRHIARRLAVCAAGRRGTGAARGCGAVRRWRALAGGAWQLARLAMGEPPVVRLAHLAAIAVVVAESWLGLTCPLTTLESWLRARAGVAPYATASSGTGCRPCSSTRRVVGLHAGLHGLRRSRGRGWWRFPPAAGAGAGGGGD